MTTTRPALRELAERAGLLEDVRPPATPPLSDATRERLLAALGHDASSEEAARRSLRALEGARAGARAGAPARADEEAGAGKAWTVEEALGGRPVFGLVANLYSLRSAHDLGVGDLGDVEALAGLAADAGAAFLGLSPLHALRNRGADVSPYAPLSRLYRNPLYLDADAAPEAGAPAYRALRDAPKTREAVAALRAGDRIEPERAAALKERLADALHAAFLRREGSDGAGDRSRTYRAYCAREGALLDDFATFCALEAHLAAEGHPRDPRAWPARYRDARGDAVARFRASHPEAVDRHRFVQFELDRQLARAAARARRGGMALGLYPDLALGSQASGFDPWAFPELFVSGVTVGAPPDAYAAEGQDWGFPALHPGRIARGDFAFFRRLLRAGLAHAGALRIDHVLGLFRQWWIPAGCSPAEGSYVRFPARALLRVAAEESRRAGALLIGEDLGVVPPEVPSALARTGLLSSRVLVFERERDGRFKPASRWSRRALATANTHDLPTLRAWLAGHDLRLRRRLGLLADDDALAHARARAEAREALRRRLVRDGHLPPETQAPEPTEAPGEPGAAGPDRANAPADPPTEEPAPPATREPTPDTPPWSTWARAVHSFLCATPAPLVGLALDDLAGEVEPVNLPGVDPERFPSWTRRMGTSLEALPEAPGFAEALLGAAARGARLPDGRAKRGAHDHDRRPRRTGDPG